MAESEQRDVSLNTMQGNITLKSSNAKVCSACNGELKFIGKIPFRIELTPKMVELYFKPARDEFKEALLPIDIYRCETCGKLELFDLNFSMKAV